MAAFNNFEMLNITRPRILEKHNPCGYLINFSKTTEQIDNHTPTQNKTKQTNKQNKRKLIKQIIAR